ncbi:Histone deacetylase 4 [Dissophora globulifera]|uniref:histone deacetylase n=1 Tax=Dissophora globulifera TaxID=979702 RepID=A0A9P6RN57_9FUNG|nr:Histone deacetylase 4 [Dissophora globulifera]
MDLKLLLSPAQKDPEPESEPSQGASREVHATDDRPSWEYRAQDRPYEQPYQEYPLQHGSAHEPYHQQREPHNRAYSQREEPYYPHQDEHAPQLPPHLSISASTPQPEDWPQPPQYFVPTHKAPPPVLPHPSGLNLSSYSFLLMEKRDREREAMEKANRGYLMYELPSNRPESASTSPSAQHSARFPSPRMEPARPVASGTSSQQAGSDRTPYRYPSDVARHPAQGHESPSPYHASGSYHHHQQQQYPPYPPQGATYSPPSQHGYQHPQHPYGHHHPFADPHPHSYHSSGSTNIGQDPLHGQPQDYTHDQQIPAPYPHYPHLAHHQQHPHHRAMSPGLLDRPRFANANLSVFRQSAAEDSDGNASVSSNGSLKRRRRPNKTFDGKKSLLPGSALGASSHGGLGHYLMARSSSHGSADAHEDFYDDDDDDSSEENFEVRNGLQGLNLQKSDKSAAIGRSKKLRTKTERPFKIGELVESMKSDTDGTWFAGRVLDLEDDPHDHINPKSVLIHFEGFSPHHDEWVKPSQLRACSTGSSFLRYGPNGHEPPENWIAYEKFYHSDLGRTARRHTGLAYDRRMLLHKCQCNTNPEERHHPEQPERLVEILCQFQKHGMLSLVKWVQGREATIEELIAAHTDTHVRNYCCTTAQNRQYARENGITDPDLQTEDNDAEDEADEEEEEEAEEGGEDNESAPKTGRRGRPRKSRGSIHVASIVTSAESNPVTASEVAASTAEDIEMLQSPMDMSKDGMEVDLHSPALGRRRSSMRGSAIRMSSLVSMSSTLFAQKEEDMVPDEVSEAALVVDDDDDDDDKAIQVGPAPSEAALAVAKGMDPALASQLPESSNVIPKVELVDKAAVKVSPLDEDKSTLVKDEAQESSDSRDTAVLPQTTERAQGVGTADRPRLGPGLSLANVIEGDRRSSRSMQGQSGATAAVTETHVTKGVDKYDEDSRSIEESDATNKNKDKKTPEKTDKSQKDVALIKTTTKKKGHTGVSPGPTTLGDSSIIRPPGLTFTMSCGQLGIAVDTTWSPYHSSTAAKVAAGSLINLVDQVVTGRCKNGFAIIRPPGHHAEEDEAMGFCFFNNVGVAVNLTLSRYPLTVQKILIIDWDVHHGNGTQQIFYENPNVLYISLHRWDNGHFYPFTGSPDECGEEAGEGTNVNIAWSSYGRGQAMGDVEYIAAFWYVLLPIARQFQPDLVVVSAGFDAADGHAANIGGYTVSPQGFAILTRLVQTLAGGRVILSLEGGYEFEPLALSATACLEELLPHSLLPANAPTRAFPYASFQGTLNSVKPNAMAVSSLHQVLKYQQKYWKFPPEVLNPSFRFQLPADWRASNSLATRPRRERNTRRKAPALDA